jgi:acetylglutamate kinase
MTLVVKVGGAVAAASAEAVLALAAHDEVCVVHGAGPQISAEMERAGIPVEFVDGRRVTTAEGIAIVRASLAAVNETLCSAIGERAVGLFGDEIGLEADPVPALGLVGEARTSSLPAVTEALAAGKIPVVAPIAQGPLNVNADSAAAAIAAGIGATKLLFLTDVDGLILDGAVVDAIDLDSAEELMASGTLEGGIIPKLGAAIASARGGVPAYIGRTEVPAA